MSSFRVLDGYGFSVDLGHSRVGMELDIWIVLELSGISQPDWVTALERTLDSTKSMSLASNMLSTCGRASTRWICVDDATSRNDELKSEASQSESSTRYKSNIFLAERTSAILNARGAAANNHNGEETINFVLGLAGDHRRLEAI